MVLKKTNDDVVPLRSADVQHSNHLTVAGGAFLDIGPECLGQKNCQITGQLEKTVRERERLRIVGIALGHKSLNEFAL